MNSLQGNAKANSLKPPLTIGPEENAKDIAQPKRYDDKTITGNPMAYLNVWNQLILNF